MDKLLAKEPLTVPMMIVGGLFDQEDIYGAPALYKALAPKDPEGRFVHLVLGPVEPRAGPPRGPRHRHGPVRGRHRGLVPPRGHAALPRPLPEGRAASPDTPRVLAYETGADAWHRYDDWPRACAEGCAAKSRDLYLLRGRQPRIRAAGRGEAALSTSTCPIPRSPCRIGCARR